MDEQPIDIALAANHNYVRGLKATLVSMVNATRNKSRLRFHLFDDGLTDSDKKEIVELGSRFGYSEPIDFRAPDMEPLKKMFKTFRGGHTAFLRLFFPVVLCDIDWVLWADVDTLWFRDPADFWKLRNEDMSVMWSRDIPSTRKWARKTAVWRPNREESHYACSGVMLMNLHRMRESGFVQRCIDFVDRWGTPLFHDQDILNEVCYDDCEFVDDRWDCIYPVDNVDQGIVIHFNCIGPMFADGCFKGFFPLFEIWFRYYAQIVEGMENVEVASWWKRCLYSLLSLLYPFHKVIAVVTDRIHPWVSDFIQRLIFFSWLGRRKLW